MGKTRLLQHLLPAGASAHGTTLHVAARPEDAGAPMATLARLLRAVTEDQTPVLTAQARREVACVLPEWADGVLPAFEGQRLLLQRAVQALLTQPESLHAVALDDLHFADPASLQIIQALLDESSTRTRWALA